MVRTHMVPGTVESKWIDKIKAKPFEMNTLLSTAIII